MTCDKPQAPLRSGADETYMYAMMYAYMHMHYHMHVCIWYALIHTIAKGKLGPPMEGSTPPPPRKGFFLSHVGGGEKGSPADTP